jgi:4-amino-4-deoxy-L-arabinose transferase-like glycosyltransferase
MAESAGSGRMSSLHSAWLFVLLVALQFLLHAALLRLPYFWDEAGYYIPAARDLLLTGSLIPSSTPSNAHPPLVMAYLAFWWRLVGFAPEVTRTAMLVVSAFCLLGVFRLARLVANAEVATAATALVSVYPVFFAQSSLAHLDMAAAGLTFWGLHAYVRERPSRAVVWFSLAALAKETAVLTPLALIAWEFLAPVFGRELQRARGRFVLLLPVLPLTVWYGYHYIRTGIVFGNAEFFRYNVAATLNPVRVVLALAMRLWQTFGYLHLYLLTLAALFAMWRPPLSVAGIERPRISVNVQSAFLAVTIAYVVFMSSVGGAVLARYMLPLIPLVIIVWVSTLWRRVAAWRWVLAIVGLAFVAAWFVNPPYGFSPEDNLAYRDYILLHESAEKFLEARYPMARVMTAWPASDELSRPYLGYVKRPMQVLRIENFSAEQLMAAADLRSRIDVALVFSTKYEPAHPFFADWRLWLELKKRFFDYHLDVPPDIAAQIFGGKIIYSETRKGQWIAVIEMERIVEANAASNSIDAISR